jgi:hypothetical protein
VHGIVRRLTPVDDLPKHLITWPQLNTARQRYLIHGGYVPAYLYISHVLCDYLRYLSCQDRRWEDGEEGDENAIQGIFYNMFNVIIKVP